MDQEKEKEKKNDKILDNFMQEEFVNSFLLLKDEDKDENEYKENEEYLNLLPPGYRFRPTDEELVSHYLKRKLLDMPLPPNKIKEVNIYMYNPIEIFDKYDEDQEEGIMYVFTPRDRKYPNGNRPNRVTGYNDGYWKASGKAENIIGREAITIGYKRSLVYYIRSSKSSIKTDWLMNEFTLDHGSASSTSRNPNDKKLDKWVLCKIYNKNKKSEEEEENEVIVEMHKPRRMLRVDCRVPVQICHASSSQMASYRSHTICSGRSSQMPSIYNSGQNGFSMPQYPSRMMQLSDYNISTQLLPTMLTASSSRIPVYNNSGQYNFSMPQEPPQRMQLTNCSVLDDQLLTMSRACEIYGTSTSQTSVYHYNGQNSFPSSSQTSIYHHNGQNGFPNSSQMLVYRHNEQNGFSMLEDHLIPNNGVYEIPPWIPNPLEQSNGMNYMVNDPNEQMGWRDFIVLNQEELEPLDYKGSDNMKPESRGI